MSELTVDFVQVADLQKVFADTHNEVEQQLTDVRDQVDRLAQSWEGQAHEGFQIRIQQWHTAAADLHDALGSLHNMITGAHDHHANAVTANQRIWRH